MVAELPAIKVGSLKKNSAERPGAGEAGSIRATQQNSFLTSNFDGWQLASPLMAGSSTQSAKLDLNKKSFPKQKTIQNFTIDAQGFRKTKK